MDSTATVHPTAATKFLPRPSIAADDLKDVFRQIYRNGYFTNHGPLAKEFEQPISKGAIRLF